MTIVVELCLHVLYWERHLLVDSVALLTAALSLSHFSLQAAIDYCAPGKPYNGIGALIEDFVTPCAAWSPTVHQAACPPSPPTQSVRPAC